MVMGKSTDDIRHDKHESGTPTIVELFSSCLCRYHVDDVRPPSQHSVLLAVGLSGMSFED